MVPDTEAQPARALGAGGVHPVLLPLLVEPVLLEPLPPLELVLLLPALPPALLDPVSLPLPVDETPVEAAEFEPLTPDDGVEAPLPGRPESARCPQAEASHSVPTAATVRLRARLIITASEYSARAAWRIRITAPARGACMLGRAESIGAPRLICGTTGGATRLSRT
jgi:hypothetical protein